jgi:hypothetical protein
VNWSLGWSAVAATGSLLVLYAQVIRPWWRRPSFKLEFDNNEPFCRFTNAYWVRLKVTNSGRSTAKGCIARLARVSNEKGQQLVRYDPMCLHWVSTPPTETPTPIDLKQGEWQFLDFIHTYRQQPGLALIDTDHFDRGIPKQFAATEGDYLVTITLYGDNIAPLSKTYKLCWKTLNPAKPVELRPE